MHVYVRMYVCVCVCVSKGTTFEANNGELDFVDSLWWAFATTTTGTLFFRRGSVGIGPYDSISRSIAIGYGSSNLIEYICHLLLNYEKRRNNKLKKKQRASADQIMSQ